jgi:hypothetical protein
MVEARGRNIDDRSDAGLALNDHWEAERLNFEADLLPSWEPPHLDDGCHLRDPLLEAKLLHGRQEPAIRATCPSLPYDKVTSPLHDGSGSRHPAAGKRRKHITHHVRRGRRIQALSANYALAIESEKVGCGGVVIRISLDTICLPKRFPSALFHEDLVSQAKILCKLIFIER